jgi:hypothetical protein
VGGLRLDNGRLFGGQLGFLAGKTGIGGSIALRSRRSQRSQATSAEKAIKITFSYEQRLIGNALIKTKNLSSMEQFAANHESAEKYR